MKFSVIAASVVSTLLLATSAVEAHVTANPSAAVSGGYFQTNFRVPHGCDGNATDRVIVEIPKGVSSVKPRATAPWATTINMVPLDVPITTPEGTINTTVGSVTWSNGVLPDSMYEDFGLTFKLPVTEGPLYWNVYQHCVNNAWNNWTGVPDASGKTSGYPAAVINISNSTNGGSTSNSGSGTKPSVAAPSVSKTVGLGHFALIGAGAFLVSML